MEEAPKRSNERMLWVRMMMVMLMLLQRGFDTVHSVQDSKRVCLSISIYNRNSNVRGMTRYARGR